MNSNATLSKKLLLYLKYFYKVKTCTVTDYQNHFSFDSIEYAITTLSALSTLFEAGYISIVNPKLNILNSTSFESYKDACNRNSVTLITPDCTIVILPDGESYVEEHLRSFYFSFIPIIVSALSLILSIICLLVQVLNNSPVLVRLMP